MKKYLLLVLGIAVASLAAVSCSFDDDDDSDPVVDPSTVGVYILNSGKWGSNNSELTHYDPVSGTVSTNVFEIANGKKMGDTGNDMLIYGSKLYIAMNGSAVVFVTDLKGNILGEVVAKGEGPNWVPRQMTAANGKVYVTYADGYVGAIDTTSFAIKTAAVGPYPEGIACVNGKLYVAITDGNNYPNYENKVQVLDPASLVVKKEIEVSYNPQTFHYAGNGQMYLVTWGNYAEIPAKLQKIDLTTDKVTDIDGITPTNMVLGNADKGYIMSTVYDENWNSVTKFFIFDIATDSIDGELVSPQLVPNGYSLAVDPISGNIYIGTSDYINNGDMYIVSAAGEVLKKFDTGAINPYKVCFARN